MERFTPSGVGEDVHGDTQAGHFWIDKLKKHWHVCTRNKLKEWKVAAFGVVTKN